MTPNGPGKRNILLTVTFDGNKQMKLCTTLVNLPRFSEFILNIKPKPIMWPRWEHVCQVEGGRDECRKIASNKVQIN